MEVSGPKNSILDESTLTEQTNRSVEPNQLGNWLETDQVSSLETFNQHLPFFETLINISLFVKEQNYASTALTERQNSIGDSTVFKHPTLSLAEQTERALKKIRNLREAKADNVSSLETFRHYQFPFKTLVNISLFDQIIIKGSASSALSEKQKLVAESPMLGRPLFDLGEKTNHFLQQNKNVSHSKASKVSFSSSFRIIRISKQF